MNEGPVRFFPPDIHGNNFAHAANVDLAGKKMLEEQVVVCTRRE
jgi:hypothetical protein